MITFTFSFQGETTSEVNEQVKSFLEDRFVPVLDDESAPEEKPKKKRGRKPKSESTGKNSTKITLVDVKKALNKYAKEYGVEEAHGVLDEHVESGDVNDLEESDFAKILATLAEGPKQSDDDNEFE